MSFQKSGISKFSLCCFLLNKRKVISGLCRFIVCSISMYGFLYNAFDTIEKVMSQGIHLTKKQRIGP